jgi:hypothetical protein
MSAEFFGSTRLRDCEVWLGKAFDLGDKKAVKLMALDDPEFKSLWVPTS